MKQTARYASTLTSVLISSFVAMGATATVSPLVGTAGGDSIVRLSILAGVVILLVSHRPRGSVLRAILGMLGAVVFLVAMAEAMSGTLGVVDGAIYAVGAYYMLLEALEPSSARSPRPLTMSVLDARGRGKA